MPKRHENLNPVRSESEARAKGKKGGIASGKARREKATIRATLELLLSMRNEGSPDKTNMQAVAVALLREAEKGNVQAFTALRDSVGEKPNDKVETSVTVSDRPYNPITIMEDLRRSRKEQD